MHDPLTLSHKQVFRFDEFGLVGPGQLLTRCVRFSFTLFASILSDSQADDA